MCKKVDRIYDLGEIMKNIVIRKVKPEDAKQFITLRNFVWRDAYKHIFPEEVFDERENNLSEMIDAFSSRFYNDNTKMVYVAEYKGEIIGYISAKSTSNYDYYFDKGYAEIMAIYIHPMYQGRGIGSKFKNVFLDWAKKNGITKFVIGVLKDNFKARKVYEKWGCNLDDYTQSFVQLGVSYDEVFYTYNLD